MLRNIKDNIPLAPLSSFKVGGVARFFLEPVSLEELLAGLQWACQSGRKVFILGAGTNIVFSDAGFDGLIISTKKYLDNIDWNGNNVTVGAGMLLHRLVNRSVARGLTGIQKLAGIPGTVGGGAFINAGAFGQELGQVIVKVRSCTPEGEIIERENEKCNFAYRSSVFCNLREVIIEVELELSPGDKETLVREMDKVLHQRKTKQPLEFPSAGSMFKRPPGQYAGGLIEQAGQKGRCRGGAMVSEKHANFIINRGSAKAQDIYDLSEEIREIILKERNIDLEKEVRFIGDFLPWPR